MMLAWSFQMSELGVRRGKAAFFSGCKSHPATVAPAENYWNSRGGNEVAEAFEIACHELVDSDFCFTPDTVAKLFGSS